MKRVAVVPAVVGLLLVFGLAGSLAAQEQRSGSQREEAPRVTLEQTLIARGGLLLRPGQLEVEPAEEYSFFSSRRITVSGFSILPSLIIGVLETEKVERNIADTVLTTRWGLPKNFQADFRLPFRVISDRRSTATSETTNTNYGIGDVEAALFYQPIRERGAIPDLVLGIRGKSRTGEDPFGKNANEPPLGTGFYSLTGSVTAVKAVDPAALFASLLYAHNFDRTVRLNVGDPAKTEVRPGDGFGYIMGLALAIAPELAVNIRWEQRFITRTTERLLVPGSHERNVPGSTLNVGIVYLGANWAIARNVSLDASVGIGTTTDAPSVVVRFAVPIRFNLWGG